MKQLTDIYRSTRKEGLYVYIKNGAAFSALPQALRQSFGVPEFAMTIPIYPEKQLARVNVLDVIQGLEEQGFFLQMPPVVEHTSPLAEK